MLNAIATIQNTPLVSRFDHLAIPVVVIIDKAIHKANEVLARGTLLARIVSTGKYRAYAEGSVKSTGQFGTGSPNFVLDVAISPIAKHLRVGDVIESVAAVTLGTIATYDPVTGIGTLTGNSAAVLATAGLVRLVLANFALSAGRGRILLDMQICDGVQDIVHVGFISGYFLNALCTVTASALIALGGYQIETDEFRLI